MPPSVSQTDVEHGQVDLLVAWRDGRKLAAGRVELDSPVVRRMRSLCADAVEDLERRPILADDPELHLASDECLHVQRATLTVNAPVLDLLDAAGAADPLSTNDLTDRSFLFYAIIIRGSADKYTAFLRKHNPHYVVKGVGLLTLLDGMLKNETRPVFCFEGKTDIVVTNEDIIVKSMSAYDQLFRELEHYEVRVPGYIAAVENSLPLDPASKQALTALASHSVRTRNRLKALSERAYLRHVTIDHVRDYMHRQGLDPALLIQNDHLVLNDKDPQLLLMVLNEDLYKGELSGIDYEIGRKSQRT